MGALEGLPGIVEIETRLERDLFVVTYEPARVTPAAMLATIEGLGFSGKELGAAEATAAPDRAAGEEAERSALVEELLARARREGKPLVLEFSGESCPACRELEEKTIADPRVQAALRGVIYHQIMVKEDPAAAAQFGIHVIPQLRFLRADGEVVAEAQGVISVARMLAHLASLTEGE